MQRSLLGISLMGLLLATLAGCTTLTYHAGPQKPVLANDGLVRPHHISSQFLEKGRRYYLLWGLVSLEGFDGYDLIAARIDQGDGIVNLNARERYSFEDQLLSLFTLGIVSSRTMEVRGAVFTYTPPPPAPTTVVVPPSGGTVVVPPSSGGTVVVPPSGGTVVVP